MAVGCHRDSGRASTAQWHHVVVGQLDRGINRCGDRDRRDAALAIRSGDGERGRLGGGSEVRVESGLSGGSERPGPGDGVDRDGADIRIQRCGQAVGHDVAVGIGRLHRADDDTRCGVGCSDRLGTGDRSVILRCGDRRDGDLDSHLIGATVSVADRDGERVRLGRCAGFRCAGRLPGRLGRRVGERPVGGDCRRALLGGHRRRIGEHVTVGVGRSDLPGHHSGCGVRLCNNGFGVIRRAVQRPRS